LSSKFADVGCTSQRQASLGLRKGYGRLRDLAAVLELAGARSGLFLENLWQRGTSRRPASCFRQDCSNPHDRKSVVPDGDSHE
jgi:hypothetical protein